MKWLLLYSHVATEINNSCFAIDSSNTLSQFGSVVVVLQ